jgi:hypothetical protein
MNLSVDSHDQKSQMLVVDTFHGTRVCGEQTLFRHLCKHESEARDALSNGLVLVGPLAPTFISFAAYAGKERKLQPGLRCIYMLQHTMP